MNEWLCKKFVNNYKDTKDAQVRQSYGKMAGIVGIISNVLLCAGKILIGLITGSIAIIADGINNLADASSSIITLVGFKLSAMPEDEDHPYGHARIEYISGMIVSILVVVVGIELVRSSVDKILNPEMVDFSWTMVIVLIVAIIVKIWQASFNITVGKKINSVALAATGTDSRNDVIATTAVLISVFIGKFSDLTVDGYMGLLVALFIIWSGIGLVKETMNPLLGEAPDEEIVDSINRMALMHEGVLGIHDLVVHNYGPGKIFASLHIEVDAEGNLMDSHDMIDNIEREIAKTLKINITVHMDPVKIHDPLVLQMKALAAEIANNLEGVYNVHDLRVVPGPTHTNIIFDIIVSMECKLSNKEIQQTFESAFQSVDANYFTVINYDRPYTKSKK